MSTIEPASSIASHSVLGDIAQLASAITWPLVLGIFLWVQRKNIAAIISAVVALAKSATSIKIGKLIEVRQDDIKGVLDETANNAAANFAATEESRDVPNSQIDAARKISTLVSKVPSSEGKQALVNSAYEEMLALGRSYESTRANMPRGTNRTKAMDGIVAQMRALGPTAKPFLQKLILENQPGSRLAAIAILQMSPDESCINWLVDRMTIEQPFILFHASIALLSTVRYLGASHTSQLRVALDDALKGIQSFSGIPDRNAVNVLTQAKNELEATALSAGV